MSRCLYQIEVSTDGKKWADHSGEGQSYNTLEWAMEVLRDCEFNVAEEDDYNPESPEESHDAPGSQFRVVKYTRVGVVAESR